MYEHIAFRQLESTVCWIGVVGVRDTNESGFMDFGRHVKNDLVALGKTPADLDLLGSFKGFDDIFAWTEYASLSTQEE